MGWPLKMLVQLPRGTDGPVPQNADEPCGFEAALRRDLASPRVIAYESKLGGWKKRAFDLALILISAPVWIAALAAACVASALAGRTISYAGDERVGYGGRVFVCHGLRADPKPPKAAEALGQPANDLAPPAWPAKVLERLPRLANVLGGEMSLVGPSPLTREQLAALKPSQRHYLSALPGVTGVAALSDVDDEGASTLKLYALTWSLGTDALLLWDAITAPRR